MSYRTEKDNLILSFCKDKRVLDIGCVNHTFEATMKEDWKHAMIKKYASELVGIDYEVEVVKKLQEKGYNIVSADAQDFDIQQLYPKGFEVVVATELIEHLINPGSFLKCVKKHLAPGGILILSTPNAYGFFFFLQTLLLGHESYNDDHTMTFSRKNMTKLLEKCGFTVKEFYWVTLDSTHEFNGLLKKIFMKTVFVLQCLFSFIRAGFCREMVVIAELKK